MTKMELSSTSTGHHYEYRPHCAGCGRFTTWDADQYTPWGGPRDVDPPDPQYLCDACAERDYQRVLKGLLRDGLPPQGERAVWVPGSYWHRARAVARGLWRHGLRDRPVRHDRVRCESKGSREVWWCECGRPERHPAHDPQEAQRVRTPVCRFERRVGRNIGRTVWREWCACGWNSGWHPGDRAVDYLGMGDLLRDHIETAVGRRWRWSDGLSGVRYEHLVDGEWVEDEPIAEVAS